MLYLCSSLAIGLYNVKDPVFNDTWLVPCPISGDEEDAGGRIGNANANEAAKEAYSVHLESRAMKKPQSKARQTGILEIYSMKEIEAKNV